MSRLLDRALDEVLEVCVGYPLDAMEELMAAGEEAAGPLLDGFARRADRPGTDVLPALVVLSEIRSNLSIEPLSRFLQVETATVLCHAAAYALGCIGDSAVVRLMGLCSEASTPSCRFWAAFALGTAATPTAVNFLREAISKPGLEIPAAVALSAADDWDSIDRVYSIYERYPRLDWVMIGLEVLIAGFGTPLSGLPGAWRTYWRRRPPDWNPGDSAARQLIAAWVSQEEPMDGDSRKEPLSELARCSLDSRRDLQSLTCWCCGLPERRVLGVKMCPEMAYATLLNSEVLLLAFLREHGTRSLSEALDLLDQHMAQDWQKMGVDGHRQRTAAHELLETMRLDGVREVDAALALLRGTRASLSSAWGLPLEYLADGRMMAIARDIAIGRRNPGLANRLHIYTSPATRCYCGSKKPLNGCCFRLN